MFANHRAHFHFSIIEAGAWLKNALGNKRVNLIVSILLVRNLTDCLRCTKVISQKIIAATWRSLSTCWKTTADAKTIICLFVRNSTSLVVSLVASGLNCAATSFKISSERVINNYTANLDGCKESRCYGFQWRAEMHWIPTACMQSEYIHCFSLVHSVGNVFFFNLYK